MFSQAKTIISQPRVYPQQLMGVQPGAGIKLQQHMFGNDPEDLLFYLLFSKSSSPFLSYFTVI